MPVNDGCEKEVHNCKVIRKLRQWLVVPVDILNVHLYFRLGQHVMSSSAVSTLHTNHPHPLSESSRSIPTWLGLLLTAALTVFS